MVGVSVVYKKICVQAIQLKDNSIMYWCRIMYWYSLCTAFKIIKIFDDFKYWQLMCVTLLRNPILTDVTYAVPFLQDMKLW